MRYPSLFNIVTLVDCISLAGDNAIIFPLFKLYIIGKSEFSMNNSSLSCVNVFIISLSITCLFII